MSNRKRDAKAAGCNFYMRNHILVKTPGKSPDLPGVNDTLFREEILSRFYPIFGFFLGVFSAF
jgi:hypothetical protein